MLKPLITFPAFVKREKASSLQSKNILAE